MLDFLIHSPVEHFARETPEHPALRFKGTEMSYADLDRESNRLAHALLDAGLESHERVGIYMHKSLELGVAIYGILKAGGVFVPLDPFAPVARTGFMIEDCRIRFLVTSDAMTSKLTDLPDVARPSLFGASGRDGLVAKTWEEIRDFPDASPEVELIDQDLGYIMYTSGSTGHPKGMMHTHHGSVSYARWGALHVGLRPDDRVASHAPLHFDLSIFDFFSTVQSGATVVLVPEPVTKFPASWTGYVESEGISVVFTVPYTLIEMLHRGAMERFDLSSLRWVLFGGEPFPPKHLRELMAELPEVRFTNVYGPAEAPSCTCFDVLEITSDDEPIPIGIASRNSEALILDENDAECPVGEAGELCIRSSTLMKGYWNRPELNERVFFFRDSDGPFPHVYYRTGDVVLRHEDGLLRFLGRKDRMVKTRGHRVELDEVELALTAHDAVSEAAAFTVPDTSGSRGILAAVTLHPNREATDADIRQAAKERLPGYAVPEEIRIMDDLPRTSSGKIDRNRLATDAERRAE
ncbi:MAG: amino acid adenylation domain-containing protein [Gemmatimonadota bacterium]